MITIKLPDGSTKQFEKSITVMEVAQSIGAGLARAALAGKVDDKIVDTSYLIEHDAKLAIITEKDKEGLEIIRHSTAHLLAHAVKELFPDAQVTIGPVIEDGFYYDFSYKKAFTPEDLLKIEAKMHEIAKRDLTVTRKVMNRADAINYFEQIGEHYKVQIIQSIPESEPLAFYEENGFVDLCRGPHVPNTSKLKVFKLMKLAGAYWRGDSKNEMLQRIYGTAWTTKEDLQSYLHRLEEAEKRDHRKIAKALNLFHMQEEAPGMVFWHHDGWVIYQIVENYMRQKLRDRNYLEVKTPQLVSRSLWEQSGHWEKFGDVMFTSETEDHVYAVKPMNCPCHVQIFNQGIKSYRDLPLRMAEFGSCHRNEPSGSLHGLMRVRNFVQDDAHVFCTEDQIQTEVIELIRFVYEVYKDFGFDDIEVKLSTRPKERIGSDEIWDKAEKDLRFALDSQGLKWMLQPGEGAFYGPKIEFQLRDCIGRIWQCGTIQLDFAIPQRLGAEYVAEDGTRQTPIMIHRAIFGALERFIGILIEHYAGFFPLWLAPLQVMVLNITDAQSDYAQSIQHQLQQIGYRVKTDLRNEKVGYKIREHTLKRVPYLLVIGEKEKEGQTISVRKRDGTDLGIMSLPEFIKLLQQDVIQLGRIS
jgi:threonyl-tRNA synthetase